MFFDGRSIKKEEYKHVNEFTFSNREEYKNQIKLILREIINTQLPKRDGFSNKEIVTGLLKNWFTHNFKVEYLGDQLIDMSPGKKSFVLLRLLIDLDNSKCPILIDQPEDDLDNRSIYNQVVKFLRKKKSERQIIIATHNPNLVLGADAEQIIVANQEGKDSKNKSSKFEYVSGSIEHSFKDNLVPEILYSQGVQEHICDILEGGEEAFLKRKNKYRFKQ
jgi:predicted ATPase